jgi:hypothetical protein
MRTALRPNGGALPHRASLSRGFLTKSLTPENASGLTSTGYPTGYYAAFMLDPDGNNMEAVFRDSSPVMSDDGGA